jgi:hypothetical protein
VRTEKRFQDVGEDDADMPGPSLPLTAEEKEDLENQTFGNAEDINMVSAEEKIC